LHPRLQLQKLVGIASVQGQFIHGAVVDHSPELGAGGIDQRSLRRHVDHFLRCAQLHGHVQRDYLVDIERNALANVLLEPG
jgi:hypothetical protein